MRSRHLRTLTTLTLLLAAVAVAFAPLHAHKPVTSRFTYEEHVRQVFERRCGRCHRPGGPAPMSLLSYDDARPWAEAIKEEVLSERMPPWGVDESAVPLEGDRRLTAGELDRIADWATGGAPRGEPPEGDPPAASQSESSDEQRPGPVLRFTIDHALPADRKEDVVERSFPIAPDAGRFATAVRFDPGNDALLHDAVLELVAGARVELLLAWTPASPPLRYPDGAARPLPEGAALRARLRYRRPWNLAEPIASARSAIELELAGERPDVEVRAIAVHAGGAGETRESAGFPGPGDGRLLGVTPLVAAPGVRVEARLDGRVVLRAGPLDPAWPLRYRLAAPLPAPNGRFEVAAEPPGAAATVWFEVLVPRERTGGETR